MTLPTSGGSTASPGTLDSVVFVPFVSDAAARIAYNASWNEFTFWTTNAARCDP